MSKDLHPGRVLAFLVLLALMISMTYVVSGQLFKFGAMTVSAFATGEGADGATRAGELMHRMIPLHSGMAIIMTIVLTFYVVRRFLKTPVEQRSAFLKRMFLYEALVVGVVVVLFPFFWMLCTYFKPS
jgi:small-conductance mechanosensitive channel